MGARTALDFRAGKRISVFRTGTTNHMTRIEKLLRERIGLDPASVGSSAINRTARLRMKALGVAVFEEYVKLAEKSRAEWTELVAEDPEAAARLDRALGVPAG